jgi:hypothetical protein
MQTFQTAFVEVMKLPADKVNAMVHPFPHLRDAHVCQLRPCPEDRLQNPNPGAVYLLRDVDFSRI